MLKVNPATPIEPNVLAVLEHIQAAAGAALLGKDAAAIASPATLSAAQDILSGGKRDNLTAQIASGLRAVDLDKKLSIAEGLLAAFLTALNGRPLC